MKRFITLILLSVFLFASVRISGEELSKALADGRVTAQFQGTGGSSGDAIMVSLKKTDKAGPGLLTLKIAPGTRLVSSSSSEQSMVIAGIRGRVVSDTSYEPVSIIKLSSSETRKYALEAYCAEFEKDNPSTSNNFTLAAPDLVLACILRETAQLSTEAKQAAIWIHTDHVTFAHLNEKFTVSNSEWEAAQAAVKRCR